MNNKRRLTKSRDDHWFLGIIGGIGQYFGLSADAITLMRILFIVLLLGSFSGLFWIYIIIGFILPDADGRTRSERKQEYYKGNNEYQERWQKKSERMKEKSERMKEKYVHKSNKYADKADGYEAKWGNAWDNDTQPWESSSDHKIKEAEKIDDDDWSDF